MSRIRSIHPGLWTDEAFVSLSAFARLMFLAIWNEADDKGTFPWSPLQLKMRCLPADNVDAGELLAEIEAAGSIRRYEISGKWFGAVRNFGKFQRPKKPNDIHPVTAEILAFCGHGGEPRDDEAPEVPNQFPTGGEKPSQMEDGGGREGGRVKAYAFTARVIRLTKRDYDEWRKRFHAIPDIDAALHSCDAWLSGEPEAKQQKWFGTAASWLADRHQRHLAQRQRAASADSEMPFA